MPQLANIVVNDRKATPVAHTFTPRDITNGVGTLIETSGVPIGNNRISISLARTKTAKHKATMKFAFPIVQNSVVNGVTTPVVVRTSYADVTFTFDDTSSEAERADTVGLVANSLAAGITVVNDTVVKLQGVY